MGFMSSLGNVFSGPGGLVTNISNALFGGTADDDIHRAIGSSQNLADSEVRIGRDTLNFAKDQADKYEPYFTEGLDLQNEISRDALDRSRDQTRRYLDTFAPIEDRVARDSMGWDSAENLDRARQQAGADVTRSFGQQRDIAERSATRYGLKPGSGRFSAGVGRGIDIAEAAARAGAETGAVDKRRMEALGLRQQAANLGRGFPATANQSAQVGSGAASAGVSGAATALTSPVSAINSTAPWFSNAGSNYNNAGNLGIGLGNLENKRNDQLIDIAGTVGGYMMSSEKVKTDKEPVDGDIILEGLEEIPVEQWRYKAGGPKRVGPYAEDVRDQFGEDAAPGGEMIDLVTMNGIALKAIQTLAKKVRKMEEAGGPGLHMVAAKRNTEPKAQRVR